MDLGTAIPVGNVAKSKKREQAKTRNLFMGNLSQTNFMDPDSVFQRPAIIHPDELPVKVSNPHLAHQICETFVQSAFSVPGHRIAYLVQMLMLRLGLPAPQGERSQLPFDVVIFEFLNFDELVHRNISEYLGSLARGPDHFQAFYPVRFA